MPLDLRSIVHTPLLVPSPLQPYRREPGRHAIHDDLVLTASGGSGPDFNSAFVLGPIPPERVFALADAFFDATGYSIVVEVESAGPMEDDLRARGWQMDEEEPALALAPIPAPPPPPTGLTIQLVTTDAEFADFMAVSQTAHRWIPSLAAARDPAVALFVGYDGATPVATSRIARHRDVGDINGVVTLPAHRRRGFGATMTWAAITEGVRRGCVAMTLTATAMGYPVYVRMGFVPVCTYRTYLPVSVQG
ncbi:MAG: GNAT family N-acetyltransferase [Thermomicrobia bacterium]|nr:GNAT family N-acetyltransferase [Thermomicrobia bacterium]MCA1725563.1 GNAT family N-acetyltransferase [Thermomicrobia bacterium]